MGKKGQLVFTGGGDEEALARGIFDTYTTTNLRYSQLAPLDMYTEKNTGNNLPAQIELFADEGDAYKFLFMAKGGGSANKSYLYQETKALLNPASLHAFVDEKVRSLGTAACPPYHLAVVVGGTSAEYALKTAKLASARYLDTLPTQGSPLGHGFRDLELEQQVLEITRKTGIGAQFGGKYFCHDVRVIPAAASWRFVSRSRSRFPAQRTDRRSRRSPKRASSSSSSKPIRPSTCPRRPTKTSVERSWPST